MEPRINYPGYLMQTEPQSIVQNIAGKFIQSKPKKKCRFSKKMRYQVALSSLLIYRSVLDLFYLYWVEKPSVTVFFSDYIYFIASVVKNNLKIWKVLNSVHLQSQTATFFTVVSIE